MNDKLKTGLVVVGLLILGGLGTVLFKQPIQRLGAGVNTGERVVMNEVATTTVGGEFLVNDDQHVIFTVANTASTGTHKFACSYQKDVDFATAAGVTNRWDYIYAVDLNSDLGIPGDTGWVTTNNSEVRSFEVNTNGAYYCTALWTRTSGTSSVYMRPFNNQ